MPDRRAFCAALLAFSPRVVFGSAVKKPTLGFSTYGLPKLSTEKALTLLAKVGFDSVEIAVLPDRDAAPNRLSADRRKELRDRLRDSNLKLTALMENLTPSLSAANHAASLDRLRAAADLAGDLGARQTPLIETVLGGGEWTKQRTLYRDRLGDWIRVCAARKVVLAIKPHRFGAMSLPEHAIWLIGQLRGTPWLRLVFDESHYAGRGLDTSKFVAAAGPYIAFVAVKDVKIEGKRAVFLLPGEIPADKGGIDYPAFFGQLHKVGYQGDINCEVSGMVFAKPDYDGEVAVRICYKHMSAALRKAGLRE